MPTYIQMNTNNKEKNLNKNIFKTYLWKIEITLWSKVNFGRLLWNPSKYFVNNHQCFHWYIFFFFMIKITSLQSTTSFHNKIIIRYIMNLSFKVYVMIIKTMVWHRFLIEYTRNMLINSQEQISYLFV